MTDTEIDKLEAGPELDAMVEKAADMEWCYTISGDVETAIEFLLDYVNEHRGVWSIDNKAVVGQYRVCINGEHAEAPTIPLAICRAFLKAVEAMKTVEEK